MFSEFLVALFSLAVSLIFFGITFTFPKVSADPGGLALFPRFFAVMTAIPAALLLISYSRRFFAKKKSRSGDSERTPLKNFFKDRTFLAFLLTFLFPAILYFAGFLPACVIFLFLLVKLLGGRTGWAAFYSLALSGTLFYVFGVLVGTHLPSGLLGSILENLN